MSDEFDRASDREMADRARALDEQRLRAGLDAAGCEDCTDCGDPIPAERRTALPSAVRCAPCQYRFEHRAGLWR